MHQPALNYMALEIRNYLGKKYEGKKSGLPGEVRLYDTRLHNIQYNCTFVYYSCVAYLALPLVFLTSFSFKFMKTEFEHVDQAALSHQVLDSAAWPSSISFTGTDILKILVAEDHHMEGKQPSFLSLILLWESSSSYNLTLSLIVHHLSVLCIFGFVVLFLT